MKKPYRLMKIITLLLVIISLMLIILSYAFFSSFLKKRDLFEDKSSYLLSLVEKNLGFDLRFISKALDEIPSKDEDFDKDHLFYFNPHHDEILNQIFQTKSSLFLDIVNNSELNSKMFSQDLVKKSELMCVIYQKNQTDQSLHIVKNTESFLDIIKKENLILNCHLGLNPEEKFSLNMEKMSIAVQSRGNFDSIKIKAHALFYYISEDISKKTIKNLDLESKYMLLQIDKNNYIDNIKTKSHFLSGINVKTINPYGNQHHEGSIGFFNFKMGEHQKFEGNYALKFSNLLIANMDFPPEYKKNIPFYLSLKVEWNKKENPSSLNEGNGIQMDSSFGFYNMEFSQSKEEESE